MSEIQKFRKPILFSGIIVYAIFGILALYYYQERTLFIDVAYQTFNILRTRTFDIQNYRFGAALIQIFPVVVYRLHGSLQSVLLSYSLGFVSYYFACFLCCYFLGNSKWAFGLLLFNVGITTHAFYWMQSELPQSISLFFVFLSLTDKWNSSIKTYQWIILIIFIIVLVYFHPLMPFIFLFTTGFFWSSKKWERKFLIQLTLIFFFTLLAKNIITPVTPYDHAAMSSMKNFAVIFPHYWNLPSYHFFFENCLTNYFLFPVLVIVLVTVFSKKGEWKKLFWIAACFTAYWLLVSISYYNNLLPYYMENLYMPLCFILILPFIEDILPVIPKTVFTLLFFLFFTLRLVQINAAHMIYTNHVAWNKNLILKTAHLPFKKLIISERSVPMDTLMTDWASAYELLLTSSLHSPGLARCILITPDPEKFELRAKKKYSFLTPFGDFHFSDLPQNYFQLSDTSGYYFLSQQ